MRKFILIIFVLNSLSMVASASWFSTLLGADPALDVEMNYSHFLTSVADERVYLAPLFVDEQELNQLRSQSATLNVTLSGQYEDSSWQEKMKTLPEQSSGQFDWISYYELNQRAKKIWIDILACQNNQEDLAKKSYYEQNFCQDAKSNQELIDDLKNLHQDIGSFLSSAAIPSPKDFAFNNFPGSHPLVSQILLEKFNSFIWGQSTYDFQKNVPDLISLLYTNSRKYVQGVSFYPASNLLQVKKTNPRALVFANIFYLLYFHSEDCSGLGLWPDAGYAQLHAFIPYLQNTILKNVTNKAERRRSVEFDSQEFSESEKNGLVLYEFGLNVRDRYLDVCKIKQNAVEQTPFHSGEDLRLLFKDTVYNPLADYRKLNSRFKSE